MYKKFLGMLVISFFIMYGVMFLNVHKLDHIYLSTTRAYMSLLMVSPMAIFMLLMMGHMYQNKKLNGIIMLSGVAVFAIALVLLRTQTPVQDEQYMKAMIPHHSSAILVSQKATLKDPELKELSKQIIESQEKEIAQMKKILERIKNK